VSKVTLIGAGSVLWSPKVLGDFYIVPEQPIHEICLMDIALERLDPIARLADLMAAQTGRQFEITKENNLERAVKGADYVVTAIAPGGLKAMENDLLVPEKYGIHPTVGDTIGPSGFSRLLRNVPVFLDISQRVERIAPEAWFINISNPLTAITKLIATHTSLKTLGLCAGIVNHIWILKDLLGIDHPSELDFKVGGIDHCSWFLELIVAGNDLYPALRALSIEELDSQSSMRHSKDEWANLDSLRAGFALFKRLGYLPAIGDRHIGEFFPFFVKSEESLEEYGMKRTNIGHRMAWGENAQKELRAILSGEKELVITKTRDIVVDVINALAGAGQITTTINYPNEGQITNLPKGSIVETLGTVNTNKISPQPIGSLPSPLVPAVLPHILREELALEAGLQGSRELLISAFSTDPSVQEASSIPQMVDDLLEANSDFLPQFCHREDYPQ
jgi:alpha-galactosidase